MPDSPLPDAPVSADAVRWFYSQNGAVIGPMPLASLRALWRAKELPSDTLAVPEGSENWQALTEVLGPLSVPSLPPPLPPALPGQSRPPVLSPLPVFALKGASKRIEVYPDKLELTPVGFRGLATHGIKGTKTIPFRSITAIQFQPRAYLQFSILGGQESRGGLWQAVTDENTFLFVAKDNDTVQQIKSYIESRINELETSKTRITAPAQRSLSEELKSLAELRASGVLSDTEFEAAKKRLLA